MADRKPNSSSSAGSRRDFLKKSALGAVAAGGISLARSAHAAGDQTIRIGMIGSGGRCTGAAANAMNAGKDVRLVAMCDLFEDRMLGKREVLRKTHPEQALVDDDHCFLGLDGYKQVIECSDVVLIACASKFHPMYMRAAIEAGKHVFVEKPHGVDPPGLRQVDEACKLAEDKGLSVMSGLHSRHDLGWQETVKRIHDGAIGDIVSVQSMFLRAPYVLRVRRPEISELHYQFDNWYHFCWLSGDDVTQSLVHNLDRVEWMLHEEQPLHAFGLGGRSSSFGELYGDVFDHHTAVYEYASGTRVYALCRTQAGCYNKSSDIVMGTKGICDLGSRKIEGETNWKYEGPRPSAYDEEQRVLMEAVRNGKPVNSGYHMTRSTMVGVLGQIACYTGKMTTWDQAMQAKFTFGPKPEETRMDMAPPTVMDDTGNYPIPKPGITEFT